MKGMVVSIDQIWFVEAKYFEAIRKSDLLLFFVFAKDLEKLNIVREL
jgi:hypothetical protein